MSHSRSRASDRKKTNLALCSLLLIFEGVQSDEALHDGNFGEACGQWCADETRAATEVKYGPIATWQTGAVTKMIGSFYQCHGLTSVHDLSGWDTSKVTIMQCTPRPSRGAERCAARLASRVLCPPPSVCGAVFASDRGLYNYAQI